MGQFDVSQSRKYGIWRQRRIALTVGAGAEGIGVHARERYDNNAMATDSDAPKHRRTPASDGVVHSIVDQLRPAVSTPTLRILRTSGLP